jgi:hypothetical protein
MTEHRPPGVEALQSAALQMIAAARKVLDAAEQVIADPEALEEMATTFTSIARGMVDVVVGGAKAARRDNPPDDDVIEVIDLD